jgi:hypothetical protein
VRRLVLVLAALAVAVSAAVGVRGSSAAFTAAKTVGGSTVTVDKLANYFTVTPGPVVRPGTSTPVAGGDVDTLALDFGTVPSAQTFRAVFTVRNPTSAAQTAVLTLAGAPQVSSVVFASSGTGTATLAAGASATVDVTTSQTVAGAGAGTLRLRLGSSTWLYRDYALAIVEAPEAPATLGAAQRPAGRIQLDWSSSTTTNITGYDVYRDGAKVGSTAAGTTTWTDTATTDGTSYGYTVKATLSPLSSLASPAASQTADATPPPTPASVGLSGSGYANASNVGNVGVTFTLAAGAATSDQIAVTLADGSGHTASQTVSGYGAGPVSLGGFDLSAFAQGSFSISVVSTDAAGNVSAAGTGGGVKDTVAPALSASYVDNKTTDVITGTTEPGLAVTITETAPAAGTFSGTANGSGAFSITVDSVKNKQVAYTVSVRDAAGNTSTVSVNASDVK